MVRLNAKNNSQTALTRDIGPSETSFTVEDPYSLPTPPFRMTIDEEIMEVGAKNDGTKTLSNVIRAQEGTTAQSHSSGSAVRCRFTAGMYDEIKQTVTSYNDALTSHLEENMPHQFINHKENKTYKFGFQLSAEGNPQIIFEEVV